MGGKRIAIAAMCAWAWWPGDVLGEEAAVRGELAIEASPGAVVYVGANRIGEAPVAMAVLPGVYTVAVARRGFAAASKRVTVLAGVPAKVVIELGTRTSTAGASVPRWVRAVPACDRGSRCAAGTVEAFIDPAGAELAAFFRAIVALAVRDGDRVENVRRESTVRDRAGRTHVLAVMPAARSEAGARTKHRARGAGNVVEHGLSSEALLASGRLAAASIALTEFAIARRSVLVTSTHAGEVHRVEASVDERFSTASGWIHVRALHRDHVRAATGTIVEDTVTIAFDGPGGRRKVHVMGGVVEEVGEPAVVLAELLRVLEGLGMRVRFERAGSSNGAPLFEAVLEAPPAAGFLEH